MFSGLFTTANFIINALKSLTFILDKMIYSLVQAAYGVFSYLANATLLNGDMVQKFSMRIYTLLGIIMVFVLAFNLLNYIVDPDKITDKKVGASAFIKDVVIALAIISLSPMLFTKLYSLQNVILESHVIDSLVLGGQTAGEGQTMEDAIDNGGNMMISSIYTAFLYPVNSNLTALDCVYAGQDDEDDPERSEALKEPTFVSYCNAYERSKSGEGIAAFSSFIENKDFNFTPFFTTIAGIVLLFFILSFCLNLAKRVAKLAIIQLIAPVPVTLELLPNKKGLRKNWIDTLIKVYLEVFMFLLVMYVIVFLISLVPGVIGTIFEQVTGNGLSLMKLVAVVILIYGLLAFGKEAPKMLFDLLGIKSTGVIGEAAKRALAIGAGTVGGATAIVGNASKNFAATYRSSGGGLLGAAQGALSAFGGAGSTLGRTLWGARNAHSISDVRKLRQNVNRAVTQGRVNRAAYQQAHGGFLGAMGGHIADAARAAELGALGYLGKDNAYQRKRRQEQTLREYKQLYSDSVESIWKGDSQYSAADLDYKKYKNMIDSGAVTESDIDRVTGLTYGTLRENAKKMRDARQAAVLKEKKLQFMEAAGKLNNFIDAHQGVAGVTENHLDLNAIAGITSDAQARDELDKISIEVTGQDLEGVRRGTTGYKPELDNLANDVAYQSERVKEKLREDAREATRKAADQASSKGDKK